METILASSNFVFLKQNYLIMKIHHLRNATLVIETEDKVILVDPMLGKKGTAGPSHGRKIFSSDFFCFF
ncbi:hypothetical protein [Epilithonimonas tenax]|uniref:hypothetical protein n=1 Tax=Epilithonimonas tenax TaxID=191577 RepID=UPI002934C44A|nr:hypothetical protein [Epilithonimonas tenax]